MIIPGFGMWMFNIKRFSEVRPNSKWRLFRTLATHSGMTNQWLKDQWLVSVKELWVKIHYPATAR